MAILTFAIPDEIEALAPDLRRFVDAMIYKLRKNAHKGRFEDADLNATLERLELEVHELQDAIAEGSTIEITLEAADVANFALIAANIALRDPGVPNARGDRQPYVGGAAPQQEVPRHVQTREKAKESARIWGSRAALEAEARRAEKVAHDREQAAKIVAHEKAVNDRVAAEKLEAGGSNGAG